MVGGADKGVGVSRKQGGVVESQKDKQPNNAEQVR